jgi:Histidine kinase-, DNA gyrase B-, and HSP90-like ATPase
MSARPKSTRRRREADVATGKLRIGDDWHAITIIALSQSNPLKAIAEFVENSIDARARTITITRGREGGHHYLAVRDDGDGVPRDAEGHPDFRYVATHICDSIKRRLKSEGVAGLQGEFGIGLLSFWTVGEELTLTSTDTEQRAWQMTMRRGDPGYAVARRRVLFAERGTELRISSLLEGIRGLSGEKIQWYLASELRDRIRATGVKIVVVDRLARRQYAVEPRQYEGRLLHELPAVRSAAGDVYAELYFNEPAEQNRVALYRRGTRVVEDVTQLPAFESAPWTQRVLQGHIDAPFINLTPGTRTGVIHDALYSGLCEALRPLESRLVELIEEQRRAEEEQANRETLRTIQRAFREALLALPAEEYDWFDVQAQRTTRNRAAPGDAGDGEHATLEPATAEEALTGVAEPPLDEGEPAQRQFFEFAGPLFSVTISPASSVVRAGERRTLRALPRDRSRRRVDSDLTFDWQITEGAGVLEGTHDQVVTFHASLDAGLSHLRVTVRQHDTVCDAEGLVTVTHELLPAFGSTTTNTQGLPGYTFERAPGQTWRSRFDVQRNIIVVNSGHRDFVFAARSRAVKLRYLVRLYAKELVLRNFAGLPVEQLLERMVELSLRTEQSL